MTRSHSSAKIQRNKTWPRVVLEKLKQRYPEAKCALHFRGSHELLVATILSAQCTDKRVNAITPTLFKAFPTVKSFARSEPADIEPLIRSAGLYQNKARNIWGAMRMIEKEHRGRVPDTRRDLEALPGVGRKTANVILFNAFGIPAIAVDTHVLRLSQRLRLTREKTPEKVEQDLMALWREKDWGLSSHLLIHHGRNVCVARRPRCEACVLNGVCPRIAVDSESKPFINHLTHFSSRHKT
jgi:endonuclease-3